jgi:hypothetical protein
VTSITGIPVLGCPPSWCSLKLVVCFDVSHSAAQTHGLAANVTDTTFAKQELAVSTLRKVMSLKATLSNMFFTQITKSNEDLV